MATAPRSVHARAVRRVVLGAAGLLAALWLGRPWEGARAQPRLHHGDQPGAPGALLYDRFCVPCHGSHGDGRGPAAPWLWPRPRDFTRGEFKWRTTPTGSPPTRADVAAAIRFGVPGTSMPAFGDTLSAAQIDALVTVVAAFAPREPAAAPVARGKKPPLDGDAVRRGAGLYRSLGCPSCHGDQGRGDGPAAAALRDAAELPAPPYDLTTRPLRRPRAAAGRGDDDTISAIYLGLVTGLSGSPMPAYEGVPEQDLWAVAAYIDAIRFRAGAGAKAAREPAPVHPVAQALDRSQHLAHPGYWPGHGEAGEERVFAAAIALQGPAPPALTPAQASADAEQCARCHAKQKREWEGSLHRGASSPGLLAELLAMNERAASVESCQRCHAPLAEQLQRIRPAHRGEAKKGSHYAVNPHFDAALRSQGITCAACHLRSWQRLGPARSPASALLHQPGYPVTELAIYERSDFCLGCHQLPPRTAVRGKPLLDTYREWLEGPYMRRGVQCQHCHMPNREHSWKGVHDPATFRQGIKLEADASRSRASGAVTVRARLTNIGAAHYLPTTPTPAVWLAIELFDGRGRPIRGARTGKRIGRHIELANGQFRELEDTRIPPGQSTELAAAWFKGRVDKAAVAEVSVRVAPDDYYEAFYRDRLARQPKPEIRALYQEALRRARASHYVAITRQIAIE